MFCPVVVSVEGPRPQKKSELLLVYCPIVQPVESHVHGFGAFWLDFAVYDCISHDIVPLEGFSRLLMVEFLENDSDVDSLTCCDEEGCELSFRG